MTEIIKMQKLSNSIRVIIEPFYNRGRVMYRIAAQQLTNEDSYMDIRTGGWYDTQVNRSATLEGAKWIFESMVRDEQRFVETHR